MIGIAASGQIAPHRRIAAFGTPRTYAPRLGLAQAERDMRASLDEANQVDRQHTELAERIMGAGG